MVEQNGTENIDYGYLIKGDKYHWTFWRTTNNHSSDELKFIVDVKRSKLKILSGNLADWMVSARNPKFLDVLGIDWLYKSVPYPDLYLSEKLFKQLLLKEITNPVVLAEHIVAKELENKVTGRLFYKKVLSNAQLNTRIQFNKVLLLLYVCDKAEATLNNLEGFILQYDKESWFRGFVHFCYVNNLEFNLSITKKLFRKYTALLKDKWEAFCKEQNEKMIFQIDKLQFIKNKKVPNQNLLKFLNHYQTANYAGTLNLPLGYKLIHSSKQMTSEGVRMQNCVGSDEYIDKLLKREAFFIHVDVPQKATVEIRKVKHVNRFSIFEIEGVGNEEASLHIVGEVTRFLKHYQTQLFFLKNSSEVKQPDYISINEPTLYDEVFQPAVFREKLLQTFI